MSSSNSSIENIYKLNGKVPVGKAIPFGLQHILAMFVANIAPIIIVGGASGLSSAQTARLIQSAMIIAGIGTLIQLFPLWKIGSGLPIVMGISFTFVSIFCYIGPTYGYNAIVGAVLVGGIVEGVLGLLQNTGLNLYLLSLQPALLLPLVFLFSLLEQALSVEEAEAKTLVQLQTGFSEL